MFEKSLLSLIFYSLYYLPKLFTKHLGERKCFSHGNIGNQIALSI